MSCDLCDEFGPAPLMAASRALIQSASFVVVPTRGPLHRYHLLVCARRHATSICDLTGSEIAEAGVLLERLQSRFRERGLSKFLLFENGTLSGEVGGCSVTHLHIHLVPLKRTLNLEEVGVPDRWFEAFTLEDAKETARKIGNYLMLRQPNEPFHLASRSTLESQHMRRLVARINQVTEWDWRVSGDLDRQLTIPAELHDLVRGLERA